MDAIRTVPTTESTCPDRTDVDQAIDHCRSQQRRFAAWIAIDGWNERGNVLAMGDWFAEEFLLEREGEDL